MKIILANILFVFGFVSVSAQEFADDMKLVYNKFNLSDKIAFNIVYTLHENHNPDSKIITTNKGRYIKINTRFISSYDQKNTVVSEKEIIMIDHAEKRIRVKNLKQDKKKQSETPDFMQQLKEYNQHIAKTVLLKTNNPDVVVYKIELNTKSPFPISAYELTIDRKQGYLLKMSLLYKTKLEKDDDYKVTGNEIPRLDIAFTDINNKKLFELSEFEEQYYFTKRNNKLVPAEKFKNYDVKEIL